MLLLEPLALSFWIAIDDLSPWCGMQVITAVVGHCTRGMPPISLRSKCKTSPESFGASSGEGFVEFCGGDLVTGVMDKAQFGNYGLVHSVQVGPVIWEYCMRGSWRSSVVISPGTRAL